VALTAEEHAKNNLPDILVRWRTLHGVPPSGGSQRNGPPKGGTPNPELARARTAQSFCVPKADIAAQGYDLSLNRYKEVVHEEVAHHPPKEILKNLAKLEAEIQQWMKELEGMLR
jgi:type I restriction enzyme M protein